MTAKEWSIRRSVPEVIELAWHFRVFPSSFSLCYMKLCIHSSSPVPSLLAGGGDALEYRSRLKIWGLKCRDTYITQALRPLMCCGCHWGRRAWWHRLETAGWSKLISSPMARLVFVCPPTHCCRSHSPRSLELDTSLYGKYQVLPGYAGRRKTGLRDKETSLDSEGLEERVRLVDT